VAGARPLEAVLAHGATGLTVTDDAALSAIAAAFKILKVVLEPAGAAALAAVLSNKPKFAEKTVVVIASGGNVDPSVFIKALEALG
jgi:threonine dehydratase